MRKSPDFWTTVDVHWDSAGRRLLLRFPEGRTESLANIDDGTFQMEHRLEALRKALPDLVERAIRGGASAKWIVYSSDADSIDRDKALRARFRLEKLVNVLRPLLEVQGGDLVVSTAADWRRALRNIPLAEAMPVVRRGGFHSAIILERATLLETQERFGQQFGLVKQAVPPGYWIETLEEKLPDVGVVFLFADHALEAKPPRIVLRDAVEQRAMRGDFAGRVLAIFACNPPAEGGLLQKIAIEHGALQVLYNEYRAPRMAVLPGLITALVLVLFDALEKGEPIHAAEAQRRMFDRLLASCGGP